MWFLLDAWLVAQFVVALVMLGVGAYSDLKTHEISNKVWLVGGFFGMILAVLLFQSSIVLLGVHLLFAALLGGALFVCWLVIPSKIGAADVKAGFALGAILSSLSFITVFWSFVASLCFVAYKVLKMERVRWRDIKEIQAPFIPFLFVGCLLTLLTIAFL